MKKTGNCSLKADALFLERRYSEAEVLYRLAYEASPMNAHVLCNLATTLMQMGQLEEAERFFALSIQIDSENPAVINNYATLLFRLGKHEEGLKNLTYLAKRCPDDLEALTNIGVACNRFFQHESAKEWFLRALKIDENFADAHLGLAAALGNLGFHEECRQHARRAAELGPDLPGPRLLLCMSVLPLVASSDEEDSRSKDLFKAAVEDLRAWASISNRRLSSLGELIGDRQPFALAYRSGNLLPLLKEYGDIASISAKSYWSSRGEGIFIVPPQRKRIRISILNEQIRRHSVWDIILRGIVKNLDRSIFEVVLYHTGGYIDGETKWAESVADRFVQGPKGHAEWLRIIREDAPDILFLPEIGMDPLTCKLAALRLAPLQVASWGHPVTTGFQDRASCKTPARQVPNSGPGLAEAIF